MAAARRSRRDSGHSLVELVVVVCMMSIGATLAVRGTAPFYGMVGNLQDRAESAQELMLAREYVRYDLSGADKALPTKNGTLLIVREPDVVQKFGVPLGESDPGIEYRFQEGRLFRQDHVYGDVIVVAEGLDSFSVTRVGGSETRIQFQDGTGADAHHVTLVWPK